MPAITHRTKVTESTSVRTEEAINILRVLAYFDIFQYPLTKEEIRKFMGSPITGEGIDRILEEMLANETLFLYSGFYSLHNNPLTAHRRRGGNKRAEKLMPKAIKIGRFLYYFPFVRAVGISGSLSKSFADENADIDFFIITKEDRLWIARTIMHLFKKLTFITGHQHYFCMNYYIDEQAMLIEDQNIFTAIEIETLVPVSGQPAFCNFFSINNWVQQFIPHYNPVHLQQEKSKNQLFKRAIEWLFDNHTGDQFDKWLLKITAYRWERKSIQGKRNRNGHTMSLVTGRHFSRSNPGDFQEKVLALYEQKLRDLKIV